MKKVIAATSTQAQNRRVLTYLFIYDTIDALRIEPVECRLTYSRKHGG